VEQRGWRAAGISGELHRDSLLVSLLNMGGTKLDQFLSVDARIRTRQTRTGREVAVEVRIHNQAPRDQPQYVVGPYPGTGVGEGVYRGILSVNVPGTARNTNIEGASELVAAGADGPTQVVAAPVQIDRDGNVALTVRFTLPTDTDALTVEPSSRIPPTQWEIGSGRWSDTRPRRVGLT
jgi:hypothetical protein